MGPLSFWNLTGGKRVGEMRGKVSVKTLAVNFDKAVFYRSLINLDFVVHVDYLKWPVRTRP